VWGSPIRRSGKAQVHMYITAMISIMPLRDQARLHGATDGPLSECSGRANGTRRQTSPSPTRNGRSRRRGGRTPNRGWCSRRTGLGTRTGRCGTRWFGRRNGAGLGGRPTWDFQEAYDAECAAIARALAVIAERAKRSEPSGASQAERAKRCKSADAQAAITLMTHDEPGPGQTARKAIAALREREPSVDVEIHWCPAHIVIPGDEVAGGWAKQAASEPDDHGSSG